jgi:hypothetical protein
MPTLHPLPRCEEQMKATNLSHIRGCIYLSERPRNPATIGLSVSDHHTQAWGAGTPGISLRNDGKEHTSRRHAAPLIPTQCATPQYHPRQSKAGQKLLRKRALVCTSGAEISAAGGTRIVRGTAREQGPAPAQNSPHHPELKHNMDLALTPEHTFYLGVSENGWVTGVFVLKAGRGNHSAR